MTLAWTLALLMQLCHFWLCFSNVLCGSTNCWRLLCWTEDGIYTLAEQGKQLWLPFTVSYKPQCSRASGLHQVISIIGLVPPPREQERARLHGASIPAWLLPSPPGHGACTRTLCTPLCTASKGLGDYMKPNVQVCFVGWFGQHNSLCLGKAIRWQRSKQEMNHQFSARISNSICATTNTPFNFAWEAAYKINNNNQNILCFHLWRDTNVHFRLPRYCLHCVVYCNTQCLTLSD